MGNSALSVGEVAQLFFMHVVCHFGLPGEVVHDRDSRFTADFWRSLWALLGTRVQLSTAHHQKTNGYTKMMLLWEL